MNKEKYTLITGATKGIGFELAKLFSKDKNNLLLVARNEEKLLKLKNILEKEDDIKVMTLSIDLTKENEIDVLINKINSEEIIIENLVNNAGIGSFGYFDEIDEERDFDLININIFAITKLIKALLPKMKDRRSGGILNVASTAAFVGGPKMSTYYSSKAYVLTLSEALYEECKEHNVKVCCLCPGPVKTSFQSDAGIVKSEKAKKYLMDANIVAKVGYNGFKKGKPIIIPGFKNRIMVNSTKILPRGLIRKIIFNTNK
ncbi:SDR family NAD(P)-dependent oxidoreductase [Clostridium thermobutyricum]|uniref:SDR family NAD(P)-dependent oxidoreductase n=1 Tax=Clostridium thermobutyricum TaxID=29372 RepID=UPI003F51DDB5